MDFTWHECEKLRSTQSGQKPPELQQWDRDRLAARRGMQGANCKGQRAQDNNTIKQKAGNLSRQQCKCSNSKIVTSLWLDRVCKMQHHKTVVGSWNKQQYNVDRRVMGCRKLSHTSDESGNLESFLAASSCNRAWVGCKLLEWREPAHL